MSPALFMELPYYVQKHLPRLACSSLAQVVMQDFLKNLNIANNTGGKLGESNESTTKAGAVKAPQRVSKEGNCDKGAPIGANEGIPGKRKENVQRYNILDLGLEVGY